MERTNKIGMEKRPHILAIACPAQGHVMSFLQCCYKIAAEGIKVTFVNTEFIHSRVIASMTEKDKDETNNGVTLVSVPDGLHDLSDRIDPSILLPNLKRLMPGHVLGLIDEINRSNDNLPITAIIADLTVGWILDVAEKIGAQKFGFWSSAPASLNFFETLNLSSSENEQKHLPKEMLGPGSSSDKGKTEKVLLDILVTSLTAANRVKCILGNTFYELDSESCDLVPKLLPIGPFCNTNQQEICSKSAGSFWPVDSSCLTWLDNQEPRSVIYVAFGSTAVLNKSQLDHLAQALELSGRPFLWVIGGKLGSESAFSALPNGFVQRLVNRAKIVEWASQHQVLAHSAVACFLTHSGWNSALESVSLGVPLLCWPYYADHFQVQSLACDSWKVGLRLDADENGIRSKEEILGKIEMLLSDTNFKANALKLKDLAEKSIRKGGHSFENMQKFVKLLMN